jgi:hypothetical protein
LEPVDGSGEDGSAEEKHGMDVDGVSEDEESDVTAFGTPLVRTCLGRVSVYVCCARESASERVIDRQRVSERASEREGGRARSREIERERGRKREGGARASARKRERMRE